MGAYPSLGKNMFYVYVLRSKSDGKLYIGYTSDLRKRINEHNNGLVRSTRPRMPLTLVYYEAYAADKDAKQREKMLKSFSGSMAHLKKRIEFSLILSK